MSEITPFERYEVETAFGVFMVTPYELKRLKFVGKDYQAIITIGRNTFRAISGDFNLEETEFSRFAARSGDTGRTLDLLKRNTGPVAKARKQTVLQLLDWAERHQGYFKQAEYIKRWNSLQHLVNVREEYLHRLERVGKEIAALRGIVFDHNANMLEGTPPSREAFAKDVG